MMKSEKESSEFSGYQDISAIVALEEAHNHDIIYATELIQSGVPVQLYPGGTNVKGELRYRVGLDKLTLGFVVCSGLAGSIFENCADIDAEVAHVNHRRFLPPSEIDIRLRRSQLKKVS